MTIVLIIIWQYLNINKHLILILIFYKRELLQLYISVTGMYIFYKERLFTSQVHVYKVCYLLRDPILLLPLLLSLSVVYNIVVNTTCTIAFVRVSKDLNEAIIIQN